MWSALGKVTVAAAGTLSRATANQSDPAATLLCQSMLFQALSANTGKVYICDRSTANKTTGVGVLAVLAVPTTNIIPSASATIPNAPGALNAKDFWIDVDTNGEGVQISYLRP